MLTDDYELWSIYGNAARPPTNSPAPTSSSSSRVHDNTPSKCSTHAYDADRLRRRPATKWSVFDGTNTQYRRNCSSSISLNTNSTAENPGKNHASDAGRRRRDDGEFSPLTSVTYYTPPQTPPLNERKNNTVCALLDMRNCAFV